MEEDENIQQYNETKSQLEAALQELRAAAVTEGNFQSKHFMFIQKKKITYRWEEVIKKLETEGRVKPKDLKPFQTVDWQAVAQKLHEESRLTDADVEPFTDVKIYGEARKRTQKDMTLEA
jgi:hypothetical protein